jgi:hypothetical protein
MTTGETMHDGRALSPRQSARLALGREVQTALEVIATTLVQGKPQSAAMLSSLRVLEAYAKVYCKVVRKDPAMIVARVDAVRFAIKTYDPTTARAALEAIAEYLGNIEIRTPSQPARLRAAVKPRAIAMDGKGLPPEFKLVEPGVPETDRGRCVFDAQAASDVMADYTAHALDVMIDLENRALDDRQNSRALGWCKLKVRSDGSLWAVDATWRAEGGGSFGGQRYASPAVEIDPKTRRIMRVLNIGIAKQFTKMEARHS